MGDVNVLRGIHQIVNKNNSKPNVNHEEIINMLVKGGQVDTGSSDPAEQAKKEISEFARAFNIDLSKEDIGEDSNSAEEAQNSGNDGYNITDDAPETYTADQGNEHADNSDEYGGEEPEQVNVNPGGSYSDPWAAPNISSNLTQKTQEELRQDQIKMVMNEMGRPSNNQPFNIEQEKIEDSKTNMLEEIDFLTGVLEDAGVKGLDRIPKRTSTHTYKEIEDVLKSLRLKHDKTRYSTLANELIMLGVLQMEDVFDGRRVFFGRWQPDLTDWHKNVHIKLQKMRHDTSTIVSNIIREYNIGPAFRIILELLPNMFIYSRNRKMQRTQKSIGEDRSISDAIGKIRQTTVE